MKGCGWSWKLGHLLTHCLCAYSYDTWIPASEIEASVEDAPTPEKPRKVMRTLSPLPFAHHWCP